MRPSINGDNTWMLNGSPWMRLQTLSELSKILSTIGLVKSKCRVTRLDGFVNSARRQWTAKQQHPVISRQPFACEPVFGITNFNYKLEDLLSKGDIPC